MKVKTMRGKLLDMSQLAASAPANQKALGNANMNARGDVLGANGKIMKRRQAVAQDYYAANPKAVKKVALRDISKEVFVTPEQAVADARARVNPPVRSVAEAMVQSTPPSEGNAQQQVRRRKIEDKGE